MNHLESQLEFAPRVNWLRMPLPFALDHIKLWLLADSRDGEAGWCAVEAGWPQAHLHKLWRDGMLRRVIGDDGIVRFHLIQAKARIRAGRAAFLTRVE